MEDNTEKCTICLSDFEDTEDVRYAIKVKLIKIKKFKITDEIFII